MMTVRLRLAQILTRWLIRERGAAPSPVSRLSMRCGPFDCDINRHMNNSRYLALMDLGRWHFLLVTGLYREIWRRKWAPVAARIEIDFKKSLRPGDRFELETTQEAVGNRSATLLQRFWRDGVLYAEARVIVLFIHRGKSQPLADLLSTLPALAERDESPTEATEA